MDTRSIFKKLMRNAALFFTRNNCFLRRLIKEMIYEAQARTDDTSEAITVKNLNKRLAHEQEKKLSPINRAMPVHLTIETTLNCNLRCIMCQNHRNDEEKKRINAAGSAMPLELFQKIVDDTFPTLKEASLTASGEPLLSPYLLRILDILKAYSVRLELITNFTLAEEKLIEALGKVLSTLCVSFDGASKNTFEKIRRGSNFEAIIKNIGIFNLVRNSLSEATRPRLFLNTVLMRSNIEELPDIVELARKLEANCVNCSHVVIFERALAEESLFKHKALANEFILKAQKKARQLGVQLNTPELFLIEPINKVLSLDKAGFTANEPRSCGFLWKKSFIGFSGDVTPCCVPRRPIMGNIYRQSFEEIWNGDVYREMRRRLATPEPFECCRLCNIGLQSTNNLAANEEAFFLYSS
jgi:MoaA/NifB/PqqE/SkfB family radical SAM enzyme